MSSGGTGAPVNELVRLRAALRRGRRRIAEITRFNRRRRRRIAALEAIQEQGKAIVMFDSIDVGEIPGSAPAVAGYVNGHWPTYPQLAADFPHAWRVSIDVNGAGEAVILDVEPGDATNATAPGWYRRRRREAGLAGVLGFYTSVSNAEALIATLTAAGIRRRDYLLWTAHYTFAAHICGPHTCAYPGFEHNADATQYTDRALGRNLDASLCHPHFFTGR